MKSFWLCFVPLFVAVDAIGVLPLFLSMTEGIEPPRLRKVIIQSVITATAVGLAFMAVGTGVLRLLGITVADFMIAGGILLFVISIRDILSTDKIRHTSDPESVGAVPIGVPLITGPAVLTTSLILSNSFGAGITTFTLLVNITIAGTLFHFGSIIHRAIGKAGSKTISKVASLLLAAIAVMIVRKGLVSVLVPSFIR
jgi:multiple antibiotic resistance protein